MVNAMIDDASAELGTKTSAASIVAKYGAADVHPGLRPEARERQQQNERLACFLALTLLPPAGIEAFGKSTTLLPLVSDTACSTESESAHEPTESDL